MFTDFRTVFAFTLQQQLRSGRTWLYVAIAIAFAGVSYAGALGAFDASTEVFTGVPANAPQRWLPQVAGFGQLLALLASSVVGYVLASDTRKQAHALVYALPVAPRSYVLGRFAGVLLGGWGLGMILLFTFFGVELLPQVDASRLEPWSSATYAVAFALTLVPNLALAVSWAFVAVLLTRREMFGVLGVAVLTVLGLVAPWSGEAAAYLDLSGATAMRSLPQSDAPFLSTLLSNSTFWYNRIVVLALGFLPLGAVVYSRAGAATWLRERVPYWTSKQPSPSRNRSTKTSSSAVEYFSFMLGPFATLVRHEWQYVWKNRLVWALLGVVFLAGWAGLWRALHPRGVQLIFSEPFALGLPTSVVSLLLAGTGLVVAALAGTRDDAVWPILGSLPAKPSDRWCAKAVACLGWMGLGVTSFGGSLLLGQWVRGGDAVSLSAYVEAYGGWVLPYVWSWTLLGLAITRVIRRSLFAVVLGVVGWLGMQALPSLGLEGPLAQAFSFRLPGYSNLSAWPPHSAFEVWVTWLWCGVAAALFGFTVHAIDERRGGLRLSTQLRQLVRTSSVWGAALAVFGTGAAVAWADDIRSDVVPSGVHLSASAQEAVSLRLAHFAALPQPKVVDVALDVAFYPSKHRFRIDGRYLLQNRSTERIDSILLKTGFDEITRVHPSAGTQIAWRDTNSQLLLLALPAGGLLPGDTVSLDFAIEPNPAATFDELNVQPGGSLLTAEVLPLVGYFLRQPGDYANLAAARRDNYTAVGADRLRFRATVSTDASEIPVGPGEVLADQVVGQRRIVTVASKDSIKFNFGFLSLAGVEERHEAHERPVDIMGSAGHQQGWPAALAGVRDALALNEQLFGAYPHESIRVVEFPLVYGSYSTSYANVIPISEVRLLTDAASTGIDLAYYVPAHELTHQWWGNRILPANLPGASLLTEGITEYLTLQCLRQHHGKAAALDFLGAQRARYRRGLRTSSDSTALVACLPEQRHLSYAGSTLALEFVAQRLGRECLHGVLQAFFTRYADRSSAYPTADDFLLLMAVAAEKHPELVDVFRDPAALRSMVDQHFDHLPRFD